MRGGFSFVLFFVFNGVTWEIAYNAKHRPPGQVEGTRRNKNSFERLSHLDENMLDAHNSYT